MEALSTAKPLKAWQDGGGQGQGGSELLQSLGVFKSLYLFFLLFNILWKAQTCY